jgi:hypothetical protein
MLLDNGRRRGEDCQTSQPAQSSDSRDALQIWLENYPLGGGVMSSMLVHDARLDGQSPTNLADNIYEVDGSVAIQHAVDWIKSYASSQSGLDNLYIMCHGYEAN